MLLRIFEQCMDLYHLGIKTKDEGGVAEASKERDNLVGQLKEEGLTDEELKVIRRRLYDLHKR